MGNLFQVHCILSPTKTTLKSFSSCTVWTLFLLSVVTQVTECGRITQDWDFGFPHQQRVLLYSVSNGSTSVTQDLKIPVPSFKTWSSSRAVIGGLRNNTNIQDAANFSHEDDEAGDEGVWMGSKVSVMALDPARDLIFFVARSPSKSLYLYAFNVTSNETFPLFKSNASLISNLLVYKNSLYWSEYSKNVIWKLDISNEIQSWARHPEIYYQLPKGSIIALTLHKTSGIFFWLDETQIHFLDGTKTGTVAQVESPHSFLTTDKSYLYWIKHVDGASYVNRISLQNYTSQEVYLVRRRNEINSIAPLCHGDSVVTYARRSLVLFQQHGKSDTSDVFNYHGPQGYIYLTSKSYTLDDWLCPEKLVVDSSIVTPPVEKTTETTHAATQVATTTVSIATSATNTLKNETNIVSDGQTEPSVPIVVTILPPGTHDHLEESSSARIAIRTTAPTSKIAHENTRTVHTTPHQPKVASTESISREDVTQASTVIVPQSPSNRSTEILVCPEHFSNPCAKGELCILVANTPFCLKLPNAGAIAYETLKSEGGLSSSDSSTYLFGYISGTLFIVISSTLSIMVVILTIAVIFMYVRLRRQDKKPRIRRRVIVSRNNQRERGSSVCELIDIENCCNMNECETACYEREPKSSTAHKSSSKDDKQKLIEI